MNNQNHFNQSNHLLKIKQFFFLEGLKKEIRKDIRKTERFVKKNNKKIKHGKNDVVERAWRENNGKEKVKEKKKNEKERGKVKENGEAKEKSRKIKKN